MLLDLDFIFKDFEEKVIPGLDAAQTLAQLLGTNAKEIAPIKAYDWGIELYKNKVLNIDRSDLDLLKRIINESSLFNLVKAQILLAIQNAELDSVKVKKNSEKEDEK